MCQSLLGSADVATHHSGSLHTNDWFHFYFNAWGNFWHVALGMCDTGAFKCTGSPNYVWVFLIWASFVMQFFFHNHVSLLRKEVNHYQQHILNAWVILHILLSQDSMGLIQDVVSVGRWPLPYSQWHLLAKAMCKGPLFLSEGF